jgi:hypothetical protein
MLSVRAQLAMLLPFASEKARSFETEISVSGSGPHLRRVAAANLFRLPRCLRAVLLLGDADLSLEANAICRTLVELAIQSCWLGIDEGRASLVWNKFVRDQQIGMMRFGEFTRMMEPMTEAQKRELNKIPVPRGLRWCARHAEETKDFPAKRLAIALYDLYYDSLSTGAHGDLRDAVTIVQWHSEAKMVADGLEIARFAGVSLLCGTSLQLGFRSEVEAFLSAHEIPYAFSRPS